MNNFYVLCAGGCNGNGELLKLVSNLSLLIAIVVPIIILIILGIKILKNKKTKKEDIKKLIIKYVVIAFVVFTIFIAINLIINGIFLGEYDSGKKCWCK